MTQTTRLWLFGLIVLIVIADQLSKWWVLSTPEFNALACLEAPRTCGAIEVSGIFDFSMVWNRGVSYGMFQSEGILRWLLVLLTLGIAMGFTVWLWRIQRLWSGLALAMVVGGAFGNVIDRVAYGAVVDFLDFSGIWRPYFFNYVFNIADAAISVGAVLLFIDQIVMSKDEKAAGAVEKTP